MQQSLAKVKTFQASFNQAKETAAGLARVLGAELAPSLTKISDRFLQFAENNAEGIRNVIESIANVFEDILSVVDVVFDEIASLWSDLKEVDTAKAKAEDIERQTQKILNDQSFFDRYADIQVGMNPMLRPRIEEKQKQDRRDTADKLEEQLKDLMQHQHIDGVNRRSSIIHTGANLVARTLLLQSMAHVSNGSMTTWGMCILRKAGLSRFRIIN